MRIPKIHPHILQQDSRASNNPDFIYQLTDAQQGDVVFSAGKYLNLTKWSKKDNGFQFTKLKNTQESSHLITKAFKSVCLLQDPKGNLWIHDVLTKRLLCYSPDLQPLASFQGHTITLCKLRIIQFSRKMLL